MSTSVLTMKTTSDDHVSSSKVVKRKGPGRPKLGQNKRPTTLRTLLPKPVPTGPLEESFSSLPISSPLPKTTRPKLTLIIPPTQSLAPTYLSPLTIQHATYAPLPFIPRTPLLNPIHPIFRPQNFPTLTPYDYALLSPALTLASRFLTTPLTISWWMPLLLGRTHPHPSLPHPATILETVDATYENQVAAYTALHAHKHNVHFRFHNAYSGGWACTSHLPPSTKESSGANKNQKKNGKKEDNKKLVCLESRFLDFLVTSDAASTDKYPTTAIQSASKAHKTRQTVFLAINLVHEIAHTLHTAPASRNYQEPFHPMQTTALNTNELGSAWEAHFFSGGKIQPVNFEASARDGLMFFPWLDLPQERQLVADGGRRFWGVKMEWVDGLMSEDVWREAEMGWEKGGLGVRVTGGGAREPFSDVRM